ncbi:flagellar filament capping protein FliD [Vreelandella venusta]|uniref:flagellar filament capping protein FliD n=1 Tax=Vreelandella venusta TaxID=44935 RepID=UPI00200FA870|nr:flagellar filament capping protein FliD [Halomonas venusta]UQI40048.1 flagellar filament capping protein FliD [Halomonas venusta]
MATITSLGVGSGLDLTGLLDQLQAAERGKLAPITLQKKQQQAKISAFGQLQTSLNAFQDAVAKINDPKLYQSLSANVRGTGGGEAIKATAAADALPGSYRVEVSQLATSGTLASNRVGERDAAMDLQGATALQLTFGSGEGGATKTVDINITEGSSLADIRDAINADKEAGVNATIINDGTGYRLALSSKTTGADASVENFSFVDAGGTVVSGPFAEDAATKRSGENAALTVNGITISSAENSIEGAIQGVTLNLAELNIVDGETASSTINIERDTLKQREAINGFVKAFNDLKGTIGKLTRFTGDSETAGELLGDNTVRTIESRLRSVLTGGVEGGELSTLNQLGITLQRDGKLKVDEETLDGLIANNPQALNAFFAGENEGEGMAGRLNTTIEQVLGNNGVVKLAISGAENRVKSLDDRFERMEKTIEGTISRYRTQFGQLDAMIAQMNSMSSYLTQQFDALDSQLGRKK